MSPAKARDEEPEAGAAIPFVGEEKHRALIELIQAGYTPESALEAVEHDDLRKLVHSGRFSVYLTKPAEQSDFVSVLEHVGQG